MLMNERKICIRDLIKSLMCDLKLNGCISDNNIKILENLPKETLVEVIERFGHGFIFKEYDCQTNQDIVEKLISGVGLADISYVSFINGGSIVFKTGHILGRKGNVLYLKNIFEQTLLTTLLTKNINDNIIILEHYLDYISKYRKFEDLEYVKVLSKPLLLDKK